VYRGQMGSNTYYSTKMKAGSLLREVGYAFELVDGETSSIGQKVHQELRLDRVLEELVPYITKDRDWFFGTLVVLIYKGSDRMRFESLEEVLGAKGMESIESEDGMKDVGYLTLPDDRQLVVIDGQHRLAALSIAIYGKNGIPAAFSRKRPLEYERMDLKSHPEIANADINVMLLVPESDESFGKITSKLGKQAKYTTKSADILHSDDDIIAIVARNMIDEQGAPLGSINRREIVNCMYNTIPERSKWFTTLSALYNICELILDYYSITKNTLPDADTVASATNIMKGYWKQIMEPLDDYKEYKKLLVNNAPIAGLREYSLLLKPAMQTAIAYAVRTILDHNYDYRAMADKLNLIDWSWNNEVWKGILVMDGSDRRVKSGNRSIRLTGQVIAYMLIGDNYEKREKESLLRELRAMKKDAAAELPDILQE
ncbi:MAG: DNA sulfur modification protein DndB, partial [Lachnospiraceae bacterium]|nr:DNA sulfur modification protein DndB [Lachnospiraceae bacterium]